eukprot:CAMPEP_0113608072 /NCGR_PEP_ID=MMETSP0017_2-20120614/3724_1 /TAXON_ID=2856 /ORGANISM="Cylindrotheca closterium" /LENGTH=187 /DNA_ID=CAMNT_0000516721 /DNA_START=184 /DNA_END=747 /DNA_ORIENTATION=- /assembly_acc=CAM_ASM_000147
MAEDMFLKKNPNASSFPSFKSFALATDIEREHMSPTSISHYRPQSHFLADANGCPLFDYVGRLESYEADLLRVIRHVEEKRRERHMHQSQTTKNNKNMSEAKLQRRNTTFLLDYYRRVMIRGSNINGKIQLGQGTSYGKRKRQEEEVTKKGPVNNVDYNKVVQHIVEEYRADFDLFGYSTTTELIFQ